MADKNRPFGRSKKTPRSPVRKVHATRKAVSTLVDPNKQSCKLCSEFDNLDMVRCDNCDDWFHFVCVGVSRDIEEKDWCCEACSNTKSMTQPSPKTNDDKKSTRSARSLNSQKSHTSSAAKRKQLALERIEEERILREAREKEYLDKKYKTLEELVSNDSDVSNRDDEEVTENAKKYTHEWIETQVDLIDIASVEEIENKDMDGQEVLTSTGNDGREVLTSTGNDEREVLTSTVNGGKVLTSIESNVASTSEQRQNNFSSDFWQRYHNEMSVLNKKVVTSNNANQNLSHQSQGPNVVGQSSSLENLDKTVLSNVAATHNNPPKSISQIKTTASSTVMNGTYVANVSSTSMASRITNPAGVIKSSISQTDNRRQTTYSVFTNQAPIMNSSADKGNTNSRPSNQFRSVNGQAHSGFVDQRDPTICRNQTHSVLPNRVQGSLIQNPCVGGQPNSSVQNHQVFSQSTNSKQANVNYFGQPMMFTSTSFENQGTSFVTVANQNQFEINTSNADRRNTTFVQVPQGDLYNFGGQSTSSMNYQSYNGEPWGEQTNSTSAPDQPILISYNGNKATSSVVIPRPSFNTSSSAGEQWRSSGAGLSSMSFRPQQTFTDSANFRRTDGNYTMDGSRTSSRLDANQIAARQAMPKSLPTFTGTPEEWPLWISAYRNSTSACGYSNSENLGRLQDCLKGDAKESVRCILLHPDSVPEVVQTLELLYGRSDLVIETLLDDIQKEPSPRESDLSALIKFAMKVRNLVATIQKLGPLDHLQNPLLVKLLVDKLPTQTRINWAYHKHSNPRANLASFGDWLYGLAQVTSQVVGRPKFDSSKKDRKDGKDTNRSHFSKSSQLNVHVDSSSINKNTDSNQQSLKSKQCPICLLDTCKQVQECSQLRSLTPSERWNEVKAKKLCYSCFGKHRQFRCRSRKKCQIKGCQSTHHVLLHDNERQAAISSQQNPSTVTNPKTSAKKSVSSDGTLSKNCNSLQVKRSKAVFRIVPVIVYSNKKAIKTFAYYDDGSDLSLIERGLAKELGLIGIPDYLNVRWAFKNTEEQIDSEVVSLRISGDFKAAENYKIDNIFTVDELFLPAQSITRDWLDSYDHLRELPISTYEDATPRILIGLHFSKLMVSQETVEGQWTEPIACKTRLGWVIQGPDEKDNSEQITTNVSLNMYECHTDNQLHDLVKEFFSLESFGTQMPGKMLESKEMIRAREIMESTTVKKDGRFETGLLWRYDDVHLPDSYGMALKRLNGLEKKMEKDQHLAKKLCGQIEDFVGKKYIRKLHPHEMAQNNSRTWYLPIFVVFNPKKPLKVRTVWDAAAKVKNVSLNSVLLKGPDQLVPLPDVLRRFRERLYGITGDIGEMYHRVGVIEEDRCAQRFLWRDGNSKRKPDVYEMDVLTFGSCCSPSSAQFVKNKNALEYKDQFPRAVEAIIDNTYMDDMLDCSHTIDEAVCLAKDAKFIHEQASFELGKFVSNSSEILRALGADDDQKVKNLNLSLDTTTERVLGMFWNTTTDMFTYSLKYAKIDERVMTGNRNPTKREVLRALMSIFDPLGLIANVLVYAKILLQKIWRKSTDWDEQITGSLQEDWLTWIRLLPRVESLEIPRLYSPKLSPKCPKSIQMHTFVDAGIEACAAMTYFRFEDEFGVDCTLVGAKTKVAPNKPLTVPRLELQAAVLGTRLANSIGHSQRFKIDKRCYWSDSQTVLSWIMSETRKYNQYVAFRVGEILENSVEDEWNWVSTKDNVADEATKSKNKPEISSTSRWFKGPSFLYQSEDRIKLLTRVNSVRMKNCDLDICLLNLSTNAKISSIRTISRVGKNCVELKLSFYDSSITSSEAGKIV